MQLGRLFTDDDAVSPVIGVILMVAITVILAAVIGAFVLGFGIGGEAAPQVTWDVDEQTVDDVPNSDDVAVELEFSHGGGDSIDVATDRLSVSPWPSSTDGIESNTNIGESDGIVQDSSSGSFDTMTAGNSFSWQYTYHADVESGDDVQLIWSQSGSDETSVIGTHTLSNTPDDP